MRLTGQSHRGGRAALLAIFTISALCGLAQPSLGQDGVVSGADVPEWAKRLAIDPESSQAKRYAQQQKARVAAEKELRKIRHKYFGPIKKAEIRQEGILKLRDYSDVALFPSLVAIFEREEVDVRSAVLDIFAESKCEEGDTALTWVGIFDDKPEVRAQAIKRVSARIKEEGETPQGVRLVTYQGIASGKQAAMASSANLAVQLNMYDAIPWLINAQVQPGAASGGGTGERDPNGALAWIMVGTQTAFVSDLTPVVGPFAVAFDPELSVITEGVLLRVLDAAVVAYNFDMHNALNQLGSAGMDGAPMPKLGFNIPAWREWYAKEFVPYQAKKAAISASQGANGSGQKAPSPAKLGTAAGGG